MATFAFKAVTDVGRQREQNEDCCGEQEVAGGVLLVVCDGMGGHSSGEVASRLAVDAITQIFANSPSDDPGERLRNGFLVANQRILAHAEKEKIDSMGTTAVASYVRGGEAWVAHVGDSRVYQMRGGAVLWKTADHTRVQKMVERGILTGEEAKTHADANVVTRALGFAKGEELPVPDIAPRTLREGDVLVLCSDGLHDLVKDDEIAELIDGRAPAVLARTLVDLANARGGHDNITVTVLRWGDAAATTSAVKPGARKTAMDDDGPAPVIPASTSAATATPPPASASAPGPAAGSRGPLLIVLVIAAIAVIAVAAFLLGRSGSGGSGNPATAGGADAGGRAAATADAATMGADGDAAAAAPTSDDGGSALAPPTWDTSNPSRPRPPRRDAGVATPQTDAGVPAVKPDAGARVPVLGVDAGAATPRVDAGAATPRGAVDAGTPRSTVDAGAPPPPRRDAGAPAGNTRVDAGAPPPKVDAGTPRTPRTKPDGGAS